jgi:hypothetical protein
MHYMRLSGSIDHQIHLLINKIRVEDGQNLNQQFTLFS